MLSLIIGLLGYWMGPETFGGSLINAVESIEILYWVLGVIVGILMIFVSGLLTIGGAAGGHDMAGKGGAILGAIAGGGASMLLMVFALLKVGIMIWLTQYLAGSIDPAMTDLDGLTTTQIIAFVVVLVLPFTGGNSSSSSK